MFALVVLDLVFAKPRESLQNDLFFVGWHVKPYFDQSTFTCCVNGRQL